MPMEQAIIADLQAAGWREVPRAVHDVLCTVRVATKQEDGWLAGLLHCAFCGLAYPPPTCRTGGADQIVVAASTVLNGSADVSGCPDTVAMLVAPAVLREAADLISPAVEHLALRRWADAIDDRAVGTAPYASEVDRG